MSVLLDLAIRSSSSCSPGCCSSAPRQALRRAASRRARRVDLRRRGRRAIELRVAGVGGRASRAHVQSPVTTSPVPARCGAAGPSRSSADPPAIPQRRSGRTLPFAVRSCGWPGLPSPRRMLLDRHTSASMRIASRSERGCDDGPMGADRPTRWLPPMDCAAGRRPADRRTRTCSPRGASSGRACCCRARARVVRGSRARRPLPRAGAHPAPRLARADRRRSGAHGALVQSADVDGVHAPAARKRTGVRRRGARARCPRA